MGQYKTDRRRVDLTIFLLDLVACELSILLLGDRRLPSSSLDSACKLSSYFALVSNIK